MVTLQPTSRSHEHLIGSFVDYLRTATAPAGLFSEGVVATIHVGGGHYEVQTPSGLEKELQQYGGPIETEVLGQEATVGGFVLEFTQRAPNGDLYEEMIWAAVDAGRIQHLRWYCTGVVREPERARA